MLNLHWGVVALLVIGVLRLGVHTGLHGKPYRTYFSGWIALADLVITILWLMWVGLL